MSHTNLLRASHQIVELNEAAQIHDSLGQNKITQESAKEQIKDTVKRWKNRLPLYSDPYSHWSDLVVWHHHQYQTIVTQESFQIDRLRPYDTLIGRERYLLDINLKTVLSMSKMESIITWECMRQQQI